MGCIRAFVSVIWLGIREVNHLEGGKSMSDETVIAGLLMEVARFNPDTVVVGNLHAAHWPFRLLPALTEIGCRVVCFLHDAYLFTGRCAYPGTCDLYLSGCDETCPTADHYPALRPNLIAGAWKLRREIFGGAHGIEVIANSRWNAGMFRTALPAAEHLETLELGADENVFKPGDRTEARQRLGLPLDQPVVLCAAVNFQEKRKGCEYLARIIAALRETVTFAAFGHNAHEIPGLIGLGYHLEAHRLAGIYQAADVFLGTATEEAFGQTVMEAQLCGLPVVAFRAGGVVEIVQDNLTGKLVEIGDVPAAIAALEALLADAGGRAAAGRRAREHAVSCFSQAAHEERWLRFLAGPSAGTESSIDSPGVPAT
jgi:glycosyltransferase involved in cell wall biosynthesis